MSQVFVKNERVIPASPEAVYTVLADYKDKRPLMLTQNFLDYKVESGGQGAGTVVAYRLRAANRERPYRIRVDEVVKGQQLIERDRNSSLVTTWTLSPQDDGRQTHVQVTTEWEGSSGVSGFFERTFAPLGLHRIYDQMLDMLEIAVIPAEKHNGAMVVRSPESTMPRILMVGASVAVSAYGLYLLSKRKREHA
jgi:uncharacterized protein YndB with AHSA1/START domain